jgi:dephospho-CoA kinase
MKLAVTGGVAEGKSTVVSYLTEAGYKAVSADDLAREAFQTEPVQSVLRELVSGDPTPDAVREAMVSSDDVRRQVNRTLHPAILERIRRSDADVFEVPLLIETCIQGLFDRTWVVTCGPEEQLRRLADRLGGTDEARAFLSVQLPTRAKLPFADRIVRTNSNRDTVRSYVVGAISRDL